MLSVAAAGTGDRTMQPKARRRVTEEEFRSLFKRGRPVRIATIAGLLDVGRASVSRLMRRHRTRTSINRDAAFCVLPEMCRFDAAGFCQLNGMLFFRNGTQADALVRCVTESEAGMTLPEINAFLNAKAAMQMLHLVRDRRLQRRSEDGQFVYFAADAARAAAQSARRQATVAAALIPTPAVSPEELLARESRDNLELLAKVLLLCLRHPGFSAKSVALSLARRGEQVCTAQVRDLFARFDLGKKTPDPAADTRCAGWRGGTGHTRLTARGGTGAGPE